MARARRRAVKRPPRVMRTRRPAPARGGERSPAAPTDAERRLLALARDLVSLPLAAALTALADAWAPDAPLPGAMAQAWTRSRGDKTATLALAWAREQVRLALEEAVERATAHARLGLDAATLAWLLLAACEAMAQEPASAVADRLRALLDLVGASPPPRFDTGARPR